MDRRSFLKRIAAVAAGAVVIPVAVKKLPYAFYNVTYEFRPHSAMAWNEPPAYDEFLRYPLGTMYCAPDGRIYRYVQMKEGQPKQYRGLYYANHAKNIVHHTA